MSAAPQFDTYDAQAIHGAVVALSTQVRRIADALTTTAARAVADASSAQQTDYALAPTPAEDDATTPATTCSAQYHGPHHPKTACIRAAHHDHPRHSNGEGFHWPDSAAVYPVLDGPVHEAPAADEDALRSTRRKSLRILLNRLNNGLPFTADEAQLLTSHVATEICDANTARSVARSNLRHVKTVVPELRERATLAEARASQAEEASRNRAEVQRERGQLAAVLAEVLRQFTHETHPGRRCLQSGHVPVETVERWRSVVQHDVERPWWQQLDEARAELKQAQAAITRVRTLLAGRWGSVDPDKVRAALDGTEQPTTEQPSTCTATIPAVHSSTPDRCVAAAGHYDESDEPVFTGPERSHGGWHTNGRGHVWSDRAAAATPHSEQE